MYLGMDCSTQSMSGMVYDSLTQKIIVEISIEFKTRFPAFASTGNPNEKERVVNPLLWVLALEELLLELQKTGINLSKIKGIGGAAQQHATVYLNENFTKPWAWGNNLNETIKPMLSMERSPIWMDQSTAEECREINNKLPDKNYALRTTGSVITQRFSGPQIKRFAKLFPDAYEKTSVIHLLSSFLTCVLIGQNAPMETSDATGMNLLNLESLTWDKTLTQATEVKLLKKLPGLVNGNQIAGKVAPYFVNKYGFNTETAVVFFTGDNISSALGIGCCDPSMAVISLGTSDTMFIYNKNFKASSETHNTFHHPNGGFISLLCIQNGAFSRDKIRSSIGCTWGEFDTALTKSKAGNSGILALPFYTAEINPHLPNGSSLTNTDRTLEPTERIRAVLEAQAINIKIQSKAICQNLEKIIVTGGGSNCNGFCQIIANVFQCEVLRVSSANSTQLGGIARAISVLENKTVKAIDKITITTKPQQETKETYIQLQKSFEEMLKNI